MEPDDDGSGRQTPVSFAMDDRHIGPSFAVPAIDIWISLCNGET
jgi:hypothetical protein